MADDDSMAPKEPQMSPTQRQQIGSWLDGPMWNMPPLRRNNVNLNPQPGFVPAPMPQLPKLVMKAIIVPGEKTSEGVLVEAIALPWHDIIEEVLKDPSAAFQIPPRKWEEIIAGAYKKAGFDEVTLTPRSGDLGRDVVAIKRAHGIVRVIDQVKAFAPDHLVTADDVRALMGVLHLDGASKGFVTTTSDFAPMIKTDPLIWPLMPARLGLINGVELRTWLERLSRDGS
jgi:restriction system protein